jgi:cell division protein FtsI (penicillin-binding protein 3)
VSRWRHFTVVGVFVAMSLGLVVRMGYLNVTERAFLQEQGDARSLRYETLAANRGIIFDRNGEPLAVSTPVWSVWLDPKEATLSSGDVANLAHAVDMDARELGNKISRYARREFMFVKRRVSPQVAKQVGDLHLDGVHFEREYRRYYPAGETAAHVVGITNVDDQGQEGAELAFDGELKSVQGRKLVLKDQRGQVVKDVEYVTAPRLGRDLALSVDLRLQFFAYRELRTAIEDHHAKAGSIVMLDARTGEILALANGPSFNPNELTRVGPDARRNRAITDLFEPGSTVKPLTVLAALESGRFNEESVIDTTPGYMHVGRMLVQDPVNRGPLLLADVLARSSQVGIAKIVQQLDERMVFNAFVRAGFSEMTSCGLPGEVIGTIPDSQLKNPIVRTTLAYGYGLTVTPLQLAQAYLMLATGGVRLPISILRRDAPPQGPREFDSETVATLVHMMTGVDSVHGTAPKSRVAGYEIAGKTGTARKVGPNGYDEDRHVAFFAGLAPAVDPRVVVIVVIDEPQGDKIGGGEVAGPVFARVVARALRVLSVEPEVAS